MKKRVLLLLVLPLLLAACASPQLTGEQRAAIKRVSIAKVEMPKTALIIGDNAGAAFIFGGSIGLALANGTSSLPVEFDRSLTRSNTDLPSIVRADLERKLKAKGYQVVAEGEGAVDAVFFPRVVQYGLTGNVFSSPPVRFPVLGLFVELKKPGAQDKFWSGGASVHVNEKIFSQLDARPMTEYFRDPVLLNTQVRKASDLIADEVLSRL